MTDAHRLTRIDAVRRSAFVSCCSCGWRSRPYKTAGMAGSAHTQHVETTPSPDVE